MTWLVNRLRRHRPRHRIADEVYKVTVSTRMTSELGPDNRHTADWMKPHQLPRVKER